MYVVLHVALAELDPASVHTISKRGPTAQQVAANLRRFAFALSVPHRLTLSIHRTRMQSKSLTHTLVLDPWLVSILSARVDQLAATNVPVAPVEVVFVYLDDREPLELRIRTWCGVESGHSAVAGMPPARAAGVLLRSVLANCFPP